MAGGYRSSHVGQRFALYHAEVMELVYRLLGAVTDVWWWITDRLDDAAAWWHDRFDRGTNG